MKIALKTAILFAALLSFSCSEGAQEATPKASATPTPDPFEAESKLPIEKIVISEVHPTADGGAYIVTREGALWYAKSQWAARVTESSDMLSQVTLAPLTGTQFALLSAERLRVRKLIEENADLRYALEEAKDK